MASPEPHASGAPSQSDPPQTAPRKPPRLSMRNSYSQFVSSLKVILPATAVALIILVAVWPYVVTKESGFRVQAIKNPMEEAQNLNMINARFSGFDEKSQPFNITADMASQEQGNSEQIDLQLPKADIELRDGSWLALTAKKGHYDQEKEILDLVGSVNLFHDKGFEMRTESAQVSLKDGSAQGDVPVEGQGPMGTLTAEGFEIVDRGAVILFTGKSHMTLYPESE
ncbi:MAG: LPS export ABC transporter periplasmic protein LptC [Pseudomonadota bacterium]